MTEDYTYLAKPGADRRWGRRIWALVLIFLIQTLLRIDIQGLERLPKDRPVILYYNHIHYLDPFIIVGLLRAVRYTVPMAKRELASGPVIGKLVEWFGVIFVDRTSVDIAAVRAGLAVLEEGYALLIAPEGTRNKSDHSLKPAQKGLGMMVRHTDATLQPIAIWGTPDFPRSYRRLKRPLIHIHYGVPYQIDIPENTHRRKSEAVITDMAMQELAKLLPEPMHGVYQTPDAPHPWMISANDS